jgi:hypothetical protein
VARGSSAAQGATTTANNFANSEGRNASSIYSSLVPQLTAEAANPQGIAPADMAKMKTSNMQTAGGGQAAAVGQGGLLAARNRNAASPASAIDSAARTSGEDLGVANTDDELANVKAKEGERQAALSGLGGLEGTELGAANNSLGEVASNVQANTGAQNASWDWASNLLDPILGAAGASSATIGKAAGL